MLETKGQYSELHWSKISEAKGKTNKQTNKQEKQPNRKGRRTDSFFKVQTEKEEQTQDHFKLQWFRTKLSCFAEA